jgi:hypothetical protein
LNIGEKLLNNIKFKTNFPIPKLVADTISGLWFQSLWGYADFSVRFKWLSRFFYWPLIYNIILLKRHLVNHLSYKLLLNLVQYVLVHTGCKYLHIWSLECIWTLHILLFCCAIVCDFTQARMKNHIETYIIFWTLGNSFLPPWDLELDFLAQNFMLMQF